MGELFSKQKAPCFRFAVTILKWEESWGHAPHGPVEQAAPPATSSSQTSAISGTTASGNNASQSSSQENATGSNVLNDSTVTLKVFSYNVLVLYSSRSLLVISRCPTLYFLDYVSFLFFFFSLFFGSRFCFVLPAEDRRNYLRCSHLLFLACPLKGAWGVRLSSRSIVV